MAKVSGMKIGMQALKIALPGFVIPYMAVYDPTLMLQPARGLEGAGYWLAVVYIVVKATLAMTLWGMAAVGYGRAALLWWERISPPAPRRSSSPRSRSRTSSASRSRPS
jgi:TRAP-type uncharacterized transport system fused permease subunit